MYIHMTTILNLTSTKIHCNKWEHFNISLKYKLWLIDTDTKRMSQMTNNFRFDQIFLRCVDVEQFNKTLKLMPYFRIS